MLVSTICSGDRRQSQNGYGQNCKFSQTSAHGSFIHWSYGVTVSTLDSESSDRGSNPRRTLSKFARARLKAGKWSVRASPLVLFWIGAANGNAMLCSTLFGISMLSWRVS